MVTSRLGRYDLLAPLGRGGMAEVWRAKAHGASRFSKDVAVKVMLPEFSAEADLIAMFIDEACVAAKLEHPNIVHTHDFGRAGDRYFIVLELVDGVPLRSLQRARKLTQEESVYIISEIASALDYAYQAPGDDGAPLRLVHRDVNPTNIMVTVRGIPKLADFGIAKTRMSTSVTVAGNLKGKLQYMSPEQASGAPIDGRSDVYLLGLTLYELLSGERALRGADEIQVLEAARRGGIARLSRAVPPLLADVVAHALEVDPDARFATAGELRRALEPFLDGVSALDLQAQLAARVSEVQATIKSEPSVTPLGPSHGEDPAEAGTEAATRGDVEQASNTVAVPKRGWVFPVVGVAALALAGVAGWRFSLSAQPHATTAPVTTPPAPTVTPAAQTPIAAPIATPAAPAPPIAIPTHTIAPTPHAPVAHARTSNAPGTLRISAVPWAQVSIDGKSVGMTPLRPIELAPGKHEIVAANPNLGKKIVAVRIEPGVPKLVQIVFDAKR